MARLVRTGRWPRMSATQWWWRAAASVAFQSTGNSTLQLASAPHMRGRVMALWAVAFLGSTPIGGPIAGFVSQHFGGRAGLALGAAACLVAAALTALVARQDRDGGE
jgi:predicted MFS family arabinose efflux permease